MKITDRNGNDITTAQVGDPLSLRFEFADKNSEFKHCPLFHLIDQFFPIANRLNLVFPTWAAPYQMFIRELVAVDGVDSSEIMLIDGHGCPTDASIMSNVVQVNLDNTHLEAPFDAFKFPSSDIVQVKTRLATFE